MRGHEAAAYVPEPSIFYDKRLPFTHTGSIRNGHAGGPVHAAIEGENLGVLLALEAQGFTADVIFIDPPYNGASRRVTYRDQSDSWAGDLQERLVIARRLMSKTGVIMIATGDAELGALRRIGDEVFGAQNFLTMLVWQGTAVHSGRRFGSGSLDYLVVYGRSQAALRKADVRWREPKRGVQDVLAAGSTAWASSGGDAVVATAALRAWWRGRKGGYARGLTEYTRVDGAGRVFRIGPLGVPEGRGYGRYDVLHPVTGRPVTPPPGDWVCPPGTMARWHDVGRVLFGADERQTPWRKLFLGEMSMQAPLPTFVSSRAESSKHLTRVLNEVRFGHPKDHLVLARWFRMMAPMDGVFLDFYAGSGSTAEAVFALNAEDGGSRRVVVVTNNEVATAEQAALAEEGHRPGSDEWEARGVFRHVLRPRIETVISGTREDGSAYSGQIYAESVEFYGPV